MMTSRTLALLALTAVLAFGAAEAVAEDPPEQTAAATDQVSAAQTTPEEASVQPRARRSQVSNMWWHGPILGSDLELTADQIDRMDQVYLAERASRQATVNDTNQDAATIVDAATQGDADGLDAILQRMAERRRTVAAADVEVTRQVLRILTPDQLKVLAEKYPVVLQRPWTVRIGKDPRNPARQRGERAPRAPRVQRGSGDENTP